MCIAKVLLPQSNCILTPNYFDMKDLIAPMLLCMLIVFTSCDANKGDARFVVTTKVVIKPGEINQVLKLFKETNPALVKDQTDWVKAVFSKNDETNTVMVQAYWKSKASYVIFRNSERFQKTMKKFSKFFTGKPEVEINEILFQM